MWTTALVFFQSTLLAGYAFAHLTLARLGLRRHAVLQAGAVVLALLALLVAPIDLPAFARPPEGASAFGWLPLVFAAIIGLPFLVLSSASPTTQRWFAAMPGGREPYRLFAASNAGSLIGLVAYPTLVEPNFDLSEQARWWTVGFALFAVATIAVAVVVRRHATPEAVGIASQPTIAEAPTVVAAAPSIGRRWSWVILAALPAALLVAVTTTISTDIAAVPFLWIVPLTVYLATLIVAFLGARPIGVTVGAVAALPLSLIVAVHGIGWVNLPILPAILIQLGALAAVGLALHGRLAASRPDPRWLTGFALSISFGGAVGGLLAGILAPLLLPAPIEGALVLAVAVLALPLGRRFRLASVPVVAGLAVLMVVTLAGDPRTIRTDRTFYGFYRVIEAEPGLHILFSGTTVHGRERFDGAFAGEPLSYYHRAGPLGEIIASLQADLPRLRVGAVGLGAGAIAAYGRPGDSFWFAEIDPAIVAIAEDPASFTFLAESAASIEIVVGDGRLALERVAPGSIDLLVLDAFSSDAVPVHLLTVEAMTTSMASLDAGGVIAVHTSNRYLELEPVVAAAARAAGFVSIIGSDLPAAELEGLADASEWVVVARSYADVADLVEGDRWRTAHAGDTRAWTDRFSDLVEALRE